MTVQMLALARPFARKILLDKKALIHKTFSRFATRKYRCKPQQVTFDEEQQESMLRNTRLCTCTEDCYGETDGSSISISPDEPMTHDLLVSVVVHEALHNYCKVRGRYMSTHNEHQCMRSLGEP